MNGNKSRTAYSPEEQRINDLVARMFFLRGRFMVVLPNELERLKTRTIEDDPGGKVWQWMYLLEALISREGGPITMGEISRAMDVPMSTATRIIDWFVRNEYAVRLPDADDRRIVRIDLTETGRETVQTIHAFLLERVGKILSRLGPVEGEQLMALLEKLAGYMEQEA